MSVRLRCRACQTAFLAREDPGDRPVTCPKCGVRQPMAHAPLPAPQPAAEPEPEPVEPVLRRLRPAPAPAPQPTTPRKAAPPDDDPSVFVASDAPRPGRGRKVVAALLLVGLLAGSGVGLAVYWPALRAWWNPVPPDPVATAATKYLDALVRGDAEAAGRIGTLDLPPAIRSFRNVKHVATADTRLTGSFAPVAVFHEKVDETYTYDKEAKRFVPRNALGPAAETLDALHEAKAKNEQEGLDKKILSGNPDDLFDAAESMSKTLANLAETALAPKKLIPTYRMLLDDAKPPLPPDAKSLALDYDANRDTWDALLKRPFHTLRSDGPFRLDRAEVTARVVDALGSSGDPPKTLYLTLTRFRLEGIDTGWRVTAARRAGAPAPATTPAPTGPTTSSGQRPRSSGDRKK